MGQDGVCGSPTNSQWASRRAFGSTVQEILGPAGDDYKGLAETLASIDEQVGETKQNTQRPVDLRRLEILNRLLELLTEQSNSSIGVLQSTVVAMVTNTYHSTNLQVFFYTPEEIDDGCAYGPSEPLDVAIKIGVDDRLVVTTETFERMVEQTPNFELARLLDNYTDYVQAMEGAWQVTTLEKTHPELRDSIRIKSAAGIAVWGANAYIADSSQHVIFRVNMITDDISAFCGMRNKPGFHDGPREMARFQSPSGLAICEPSSVLYVCDTGNDAIRTVSIPSGVVHTLSLSPVDPDVRLVTPIGICSVRGDYDYDKVCSDDEDEDGDGNNSMGSVTDLEDDDEDDGRGRHIPLLEGITEEDDDSLDDSRRSSIARPTWSEGGGRGNSKPKYTLANAEPAMQNRAMGAPRGGRLFPEKGFSSLTTSRRTSGYVSTLASRRTSSYVSSVSSLSSRRTSHFSMTPGESAKDSLRECAEEEENFDHNLAVTSDHCIFLVCPEKGELCVIAGSRDEYGYRDAEKGSDARFSSLKGITCIRNCLFVADHWNNVIRCVNLKTCSVDTVMDFNPCGPIALTVSSSGSVYVLDSEYISVCNILKICSLQCSPNDAEGALGTTMFQMIQESIGRSRQSSRASSRRSSKSSDGASGVGGHDWHFIDSLSRRGSAREARRQSADSGSDCGSWRPSRPSSRNDGDTSRRASRRESRRKSNQHNGVLTVGDIAQLGPRVDNRGGGLPKMAQTQNDPKQPPSTLTIPGNSRSGTPRNSNSGRERERAGENMLPVVPKALRSLVPGASLHPALIHMTMGGQEMDRPKSLRNSTKGNSMISGSQFHVSVVSSVADDDFGDTPEFFSFLNPKHETPWRRTPIGTLQHVYQEATGQCSANTPLSLSYWDASDDDISAACNVRNTQQLIVGGTECPAVLKVLPPRKAAPSDCGRFRAVAVDVDRVVMADCDSNQIFVVNHSKRTMDKIAGCGKAGYFDGPLDVCRMNRPSSVALDPTTHYIYVADAGNHRVRRIDLSTGFMTTVAGNGVKGNQDGADPKHQSMDSPYDLHFMHPSHLLISCADNCIRRLDLQTEMLETVIVGS